jgi:hypothetical protein
MAIKILYGSSGNIWARLLSNWFGVQVPGRSPKYGGKTPNNPQNLGDFVLRLSKETKWIICVCSQIPKLTDLES